MGIFNSRWKGWMLWCNAGLTSWLALSVCPFISGWNLDDKLTCLHSMMYRRKLTELVWNSHFSACPSSQEKTATRGEEDGRIIPPYSNIPSYAVRLTAGLGSLRREPSGAVAGLFAGFSYGCTLTLRGAVAVLLLDHWPPPCRRTCCSGVYGTVLAFCTLGPWSPSDLSLAYTWSRNSWSSVKITLHEYNLSVNAPVNFCGSSG